MSAFAALADDLRGALRGEVRFDAGSRALYAADASNYRMVPIGVVVPRDVEDAVTAVQICRAHDAPVLPRGAGTSLAGQCCNVAVVLDCSKYLNSILEVDPVRRTARVQPGVTFNALAKAAATHHLIYGPDPATHAYCTFGGMIGNNSCGLHSVVAGRSADNVESLTILLYDGAIFQVGEAGKAEVDRIIRAGGRTGEIYSRLKSLRDRYAADVRTRFPRMPRRVSGYNLDELLPERGFHVARALVGTEGTCAITLEATVRLIHSPVQRILVILGYPDVYQAADRVPMILETQPMALEGLDDVILRNMHRKGLNPEGRRLLPDGGAWLMVEFGADTEREAKDRADALVHRLQAQKDGPAVALLTDTHEQRLIWEVRESGLGATAFVPGQRDAWEGWEDSAVPPDRLGSYIRSMRELLDKYGYESAVYGHFGDGCIHMRITFDLYTREGIRKYRSFAEDAADLVVRHGGSLSGEHGDGQSRGELLGRMYGTRLVQAFREFKAIWDPAGRMNPGKVVDAYGLDQNLRLGTTYRPPDPITEFQFPGDQGSFGRAALRCVGVGKCRKAEGGTMCPSYMVVREEAHTTRGRAHLLFEMLQGDIITDGWRSKDVYDALHLCLACKACKAECPVNVDVATYKAEFLSHYYRGRIRPRSAFAFGLIYWWARAAARAPALANFLTHAPGFAQLAKALMGAAPQRKLPRFAPRTFRRWFASHQTPATSRKRTVLLWPDTFNNHFHPQTAEAAVDALEALGYRVVLPRRTLCCGRPLYDYGMLWLAKRLLRQTLGDLGDAIAAGVPVVVLEPSCAAVFRDEMLNLFPHDEDARRLRAQTFLLSEFLVRDGAVDRLPKVDSRALVHGHCHHKAIFTMRDEERVLTALGINYQLLDSGCCGMAGAFGFERGERYEVSVQAAERVLIPAVRDASRETMVITDGFSCREQIAQLCGRRALHLADVLALGVRGADAEEAASRAERTEDVRARL